MMHDFQHIWTELECHVDEELQGVMGLIQEDSHQQRRKIRNEMYKSEDLEYAVGFVTVWGLGMILVITLLVLL